MGELDVIRAYRSTVIKESNDFEEIAEKISRIIKDEKGELTETDKRYIERIRSSDDNMKVVNLIVELSQTESNNEYEAIVEQLENLIDEL